MLSVDRQGVEIQSGNLLTRGPQQARFERRDPGQQRRLLAAQFLPYGLNTLCANRLPLGREEIEGDIRGDLHLRAGREICRREGVYLGEAGVIVETVFLELAEFLRQHYD